MDQRTDPQRAADENEAELKPLREALTSLKESGFKGIAKIQAVEYPLTGGKTLEVILELRKEISRQESIQGSTEWTRIRY